MSAVAAGAAIVGTGLQVVGAITSAQDQSSIDAQKAQLDATQASQVAQREIVNDQNMRNSAARAGQEQSSSFASSGHAGSGVGTQLEVQRQTNAQIGVNDQEAQFQELMLTASSGMQGQLAQQTSQAGWISAGASLLGGASRFAASGAFTPAPSVQDLPDVGSQYRGFA